MSIRLLNKVWDLPLRPSEKLTLSVLADLANEAGVCWPSLAYVAPRASVSIRTLQRIMGSLESQGLILRQPRYRADGSRTSSEYIILPKDNGGDTLSPPAVPTATSPTPTMASGHDTADTPLPHKEPSKENHHHTPAGLVYPRSFDDNRIAAANHLLAGLPSADAQSLIDEVAGRMTSGRVASPLSYLRALIKRHAAGEFIPEVADQISKQRRAKTEEPQTATPNRRTSREHIQKHLRDLRQAIAKGASHD